MSCVKDIYSQVIIKYVYRQPSITIVLCSSVAVAIEFDLELESRPELCSGVPRLVSQL
jgi:hypothetical protein